jgi:hypothetical protein
MGQKARFLNISRLCFAFILFIAFLNAVIDVSECAHWLLVMLILILFMVGVRASAIANRML